MRSDGTTDPMHPAEIEAPGCRNHPCEVAAHDGALPLCGAKTRAGSPCQNYAMPNGRCRMHGGLSTGPRTATGLARSQTSTLVHGGRSQAMREFRRRMRELRAEARKLVEVV